MSDADLPFKLAAFDLDGTLFGVDAEVSARTAEVLRRVADRGVHLVAATGRSHRTAAPRLTPVGVFEWAVCSNGAIVHHLPSDELTETNLIEADAAAEVVELIDRDLPDAGLAWESVDEYYWGPVFGQMAPDNLSTRVTVSHDPIATADLIKLLVVHPEFDADELLARLRPVLPTGTEVTASGLRFVEIVAAGVNKAATLARLAGRLGVDRSEVMAFGDNLNDVEMLAWAGAGYAMANARPEVLAMTDHRTTSSHANDGVAEVLSAVFLNQR